MAADSIIGGIKALLLRFYDFSTAEVNLLTRALLARNTATAELDSC
jgi:hypothetical protein